MISRIELSYPEFWVNLQRDFTPGINLIEENNWYGKSTIINTILSLYSKKYPGLRWLPSGSAKIFGDDKVYLMTKWMWTGLDTPPNPLIKFCLPGEFFNVGSTTDQRKAIIDLLNIDYESSMKEAVEDWYPTIEKDIRDRMKRNEGKEDVILADILRLRAAIISYEKAPVSIGDNTNEIADLYSKYHAKQNKGRQEVIESNNDIVRQKNTLVQEINNINRNITRIEEDVQWYRDKVNSIYSGKCNACSQPVPVDQGLIDALTARAKSLKVEAVTIRKNVEEKQALLESLTLAPVPNESLYINTIEAQAKVLNMKVFRNSPEDIAKVSQYNTDKRELVLKETQLKWLDELNDKILMSSIEAAKKAFTLNLEKQIKPLNLEIELFKTQANGNIVESFIISLDGKPYSELSTGNRLLLQVRMALAFIKILWLDFILIDEIWSMSQSNFDMVVQECQWLQMILARATPFVLPTKTDKVKPKSAKKSIG